MQWTVSVLAMLAAVTREAFALLNLVSVVAVFILTYESYTSPMARLATATWLCAAVGTGVATKARARTISSTRPVVVVTVHICQACRFTITERTRVTVRALARSRGQITCPMIATRVGDPGVSQGKRCRFTGIRRLKAGTRRSATGKPSTATCQKR